MLMWVVSHHSSAHFPPHFCSVAVLPTYVPWRVNTEKPKGEVGISGDGFGRGVRCTGQCQVWVDSLCPRFPMHLLSRWRVQARSWLDPGHSWYPSTVMPAKHVLSFAGGTCERIKYWKLYRQFVMWRSRTELGSSKTSSDGAGWPSARFLSSLLWCLWEEKKGPSQARAEGSPWGLLLTGQPQVCLTAPAKQQVGLEFLQVTLDHSVYNYFHTQGFSFAPVLCSGWDSMQ